MGTIQLHIDLAGHWSILPIFIDRKAGEIMHLVASVCLFVCLYKECISRSVRNGWVFKVVVVSTCCTIAVDHTFNRGMGLACKASLCKKWNNLVRKQF